MEYEWTGILARLTHHRERLGLTKDEMRTYIRSKYRKSFNQMSDEEILALGKDMANSKDKFDFIF